ncbi:hypothetical protein MNBD_BACTEROID07-302 [hydrothermal vent metagenome]|uniref:Lipoprotein n=1 Tax=hydrothermal vent metagenome TaxID=652676 RepID=A0A3B0U8N7_9ZZZZ
MSRKWSGKKIFKAGFCIAISAFALGGCDQKIPGHPEKIASEYIKAVQRNDFKTIYRLNFDTSRSSKYLKCSDGKAENKICEQNFRENKTIYENAELNFSPGVRWVEKHYFPASALVDIGEPYPPAAAGEDDINSKYERAVSVFVPVKVEYPDQNEAPSQDDRKIKTASFECVFRKIREGGNVRVYSHDIKWYFAGCVFNAQSVTYR